MRAKIKFYMASALISSAAVFSSASPALAEQEATVRMHVFNPAGIAVKTEKVPVGTKYSDIPEFGKMITDTGANRKWNGAVFEGIYKDGQKVNPLDKVSGDTYLEQRYSLVSYKITANEESSNGNVAEQFRYTIADSYGCPGFSIPDPKYTQSGYTFDGWEGQGIRLDSRTLNGKTYYFVPYGEARDFSITAKYKKASASGSSLNKAESWELDGRSYPISEAKILGLSDKVYTGKNISRHPYVILGDSRLHLNIRYIGSRKNIGRHWAVISAPTLFSGSVRKSYVIVPAKPAIRISRKKGMIRISATGLKGGAKSMIAVRKQPAKKWHFYKSSSKTLKSGGKYNIRIFAYKGKLKSAPVAMTVH